ncbi:type II toxin-antitoxin system VapC family toxin [Verrucomicrobiaceae bacterium E54]|nr:type II toxin-antitoxin system VapC family toxin [Verrucomicrobiaceae bacterium E54]
MSHFINDEHTDQARRQVQGLSGPIGISRLGVLEYQNSVWRKVGFDGFGKDHAERAIREFGEQVSKGWFLLQPVDDETIWQRAMGLSTSYSSELKVRSLDILHVAIAMELAADSFWSFDQRQNALAKKAGFAIIDQ